MHNSTRIGFLTCLVSFAGCRAGAPLSATNSGLMRLEVDLNGDVGGVDGAWVRLWTSDESCPAVDELARLNGQDIWMSDRGGKVLSAQNFAPATACERPTWSTSVPVTDAAGNHQQLLVPHGTPLELTFESPGFRVALEPLTVTAPRLEQARVRMGQTIRVVTASPWVRELRLRSDAVALPFSAEVLATEVNPGVWELPAPAVTGAFILVARGRLTPSVTACEGFGSCEVSLSLLEMLDVEVTAD